MPARYIRLLSLCCYVVWNCTGLVYRIFLLKCLQLITRWGLYLNQTKHESLSCTACLQCCIVRLREQNGRPRIHPQSIVCVCVCVCETILTRRAEQCIPFNPSSCITGWMCYPVHSNCIANLPVGCLQQVLPFTHT
jgi:hypothetical protein